MNVLYESRNVHRNLCWLLKEEKDYVFSGALEFGLQGFS
jgi:hypothetical protein